MSLFQKSIRWKITKKLMLIGAKAKKANKIMRKLAEWKPLA